MSETPHNTISIDVSLSVKYDLHHCRWPTLLGLLQHPSCQFEREVIFSGHGDVQYYYQHFIKPKSTGVRRPRGNRHNGEAKWVLSAC